RERLTAARTPPPPHTVSGPPHVFAVRSLRPPPTAVSAAAVSAAAVSAAAVSAAAFAQQRLPTGRGPNTVRAGVRRRSAVPAGVRCRSAARIVTAPALSWPAQSGLDHEHAEAGRQRDRHDQADGAH